MHANKQDKDKKDINTIAQSHPQTVQASTPANAQQHEDKLLASVHDGQLSIHGCDGHDEASKTSSVHSAHTHGHGHARSNSFAVLNLTDLLANPVTAEIIKDVANQRMSIEQVMFLLAAKEYNTVSDTERHERARHLYETFLKEDAPMEVNVSGAVRETLQQHFEKKPEWTPRLVP